MLRSIAAGPFAEPVMGFLMFMIGVALALPADTFSMSSYWMLSLIAPETLWSGIFIVVGAAQIFAALLNNTLARVLSCMTGGFVWMVWTAATLHSGFRGILWAIGFAMIVGQGLGYLRAKASQQGV